MGLFTPKHGMSVWTMLTDDVDKYIGGTIRMGVSAQKHAGRSIDLVAMVIDEKLLPKENQEVLYKHGWNICVVKRIPPKDEQGTFPRFRDQFTKLHVWNMEMYSRIIYLDSDTLVVGDISRLFDIKLDNTR